MAWRSALSSLPRLITTTTNTVVNSAKYSMASVGGAVGHARSTAIFVKWSIFLFGGGTFMYGGAKLIDSISNAANKQ